MKPDHPDRELLLRYLDGTLSPVDRARAIQLLRTEVSAREFLRTVSEHAVMVAELERMAANREPAIQTTASSNPTSWTTRTPRNSARAHPARWLAACAAVLALGFGYLWFAAHPASLATVSKVTGASQVFGANGRIQNAITAGTSLRIGDTLETPSCGAWVELRLQDGSTITVAGHSTLRVLEPVDGIPRFNLLQGSIWRRPGTNREPKAVSINTPALAAELRAAQFDVQTSSDQSLVRINSGEAHVRQRQEGQPLRVSAGHQIAASLGGNEPFIATPQPAPINYWACDLWQVPEVILGRWLPPAGTETARLGTEPLLWPLDEKSSIMLHAIALAAWKSTEHPVLLQADSKMVFRGRIDREQTVRFGFSAQMIRGVFAGKFEVDFRPDQLGPIGSTWEIAIPLGKFQPLQPDLSASPEGLELTDVYALTIREDAGLEINHIELVPATRTQK